MKKFMHLLLASFIVMSFAFAGCETATVEDDMMEDEGTMEEAGDMEADDGAMADEEA